MAYKIEVNTATGIICIIYSGVITFEDVKDSTVDAIKFANQNSPSIYLSDLRDTTIKLSISDIFKIPKLYEELNANPHNKLALLLPVGGKLWSDARLYEIICVGRRKLVSIFSQQKAAIDWLMKGRDMIWDKREGDRAV